MVWTLPSVPGMSSQPTEVRTQLIDIANRNGWDVDGMAAAISHESRWNPRAKNPRSSAVGLLQWTQVGAGAVGKTPAQILSMSVPQQLDLAEQWWLRAAGGQPIGPRDFLVLGLGTGNVPGGYNPDLPDPTILYAAGSPGALGNPGMQDENGAITVGSARNALGAMLVGTYRLSLDAADDDEPEAPTLPTPPPTNPSPRPGGGGLAVLVILGVVGAIFVRTVKPRGRRG